MQSEEMDGSKDVPPLSHRGSLKSSRLAQLNNSLQTLEVMREKEVPA